MIANLQPYRQYKDSGLPWLPQVPSHWKVVRNGSLFGQRKDAADTTLPILEVSLKTGVRVREFGGSNRKQVMSDIRKYKRAEKSDVAYNMMRMWQGAVGVVPVDGLVSPAYVVARPFRDVESPYYVTLFRTGDYMSEIDNYSRGIVKDRNRLYWDQFKQMPSPFPPLEEQVGIMRFLDYANGRLERAIRAKRKVISLLQEQKQAIIHRAVTRGLDGSVPFKPSGIPWLGDIPQHWDARRLRFCINGKLSYGANEAASFDNRDWPRYLRITDFRSDGTLKADTFRSLPPHIAKDYPVQNGDILFARSGATVGKAFLVRTETEHACYAGYLIRARPRKEVLDSEFLFAYTQSFAFARWKDEIFSKATIQNIGADKYANLVIPLPGIDEQKAILASIGIESQPLNNVIAQTLREISLLREFQTRLVTDVVTGRFDIRDVARSLPVESIDVEMELELDDSTDSEETDL
ncbi:restriction endonuclease subunit S [Planctomicrobium sp. SH661]|uniref:restriction endonuclease subunit S n=1 Tax=Planctomicrobium sp. SH661 TaxID=3448124 RepID=UPI003F5C1212